MTRWGWPGWRRIGAAFGLGATMALGQAPLNLWWLAVPALAGVVWLVANSQNPRSAAWLGLFAGAGHFALALSWIVEPFLIDIARHGWMIPFAVVFLSFGLALFWASAAGLAALLPKPQRALGFALTLTLAELARGTVLTGFPWALIGHIWIATPLAQLAALIGPNGLTLLTALVAALPIAYRARGLATSAALLACVTGFGLWRLSLPDPAATHPITLRLVQPNAEQHLKWDPTQARIIFDRQLAFTAAKPTPDLVIWPETSVPYLFNTSPDAVLAIARACSGAPVAVGVQRTEGWRGFNSMAVILPDGTVSALYDKHHLVPFGEYIPYGDLMADWFGIVAFAAQEGNGYSPGPAARVLNLGPTLGSVLPLICYEAVFPQDLRAAPTRPDWILQITNDAWFGKINGPYQHLAQAQLRAIEQGLPLARAANTGISAVIDARGRITASLPLGQAAFLDTPLPAAWPAPPYARFGEGAVLVLLAGLALALLRARKSTSA
ncbi:MAG: apolipoprotein N-acyltransferase [Paracoccaceae bacterium]